MSSADTNDASFDEEDLKPLFNEVLEALKTKEED